MVGNHRTSLNLLAARLALEQSNHRGTDFDLAKRAEVILAHPRRSDLHAALEAGVGDLAAYMLIDITGQIDRGYPILL